MTTTLKDLLHQLAQERNLDLRGYKPTSLERRLRRRMADLKIGNYDEYSRYIRQHPDEINGLLNTVLINVTEFFRDPPVWDYLRTEVLPGLLSNLRPGGSFRAWTAGCASGEEAYSLCILLAEHFGADLKKHDIKVYATDVDEEALNAARRGEYPSDKLRHVRPEWQQKYFQGDKLVRVARDIRRMAIFGRSNLVSDAPISHIHLLLCRNVLIYFDSELQKQILGRLHYALEPNGVLVLGNSESQLAQSSLFRPLNSKLRVFQRRTAEAREVPPLPVPALQHAEEDYGGKARQEYSLLKLYHDAILETLEPGILVLDAKDVIISSNEAALRLWGLAEKKLTGRHISDTELPRRCRELVGRLQASHAASEASQRFEFELAPDGEVRTLAVTIKTIVTPAGGRVGTLIYVEDITPRRKLQSTIERLETTSEELHSTNEELETANEELQSTNEELETTNEELQSTNEELETTNEELQALNEELGTTNEELEQRGREVDEVNARYAETLEMLPWPMMLVDDNHNVQVWNAAAENVFGLSGKSVVGLTLRQLPVAETLRDLLFRSHREVVSRQRHKVIHNFYLSANSYRGPLDIHLVRLSREAGGDVLIVLEPFARGKAARRVIKRRGVLSRRAGARNRVQRKK